LNAQNAGAATYVLLTRTQMLAGFNQSDPASLPQALELLERLPAVTKRRLLATYGVLAGPGRGWRVAVAPELEHID
jgi:hypothetical protein